MRHQKALLILWIALAALCVGAIGSYVALYILKFFEKLSWLNYVYLGGFPVLIAAFSILFVDYLHLKQTNKIVLSENMYNLGKTNFFYNYALFAKRVKSISKQAKDKSSYVVTFTTSHISMTKNSSRNPAVTELNGYISDFLTEYLLAKKAVGVRNIAFCYYHGQFVFYCVGNEEKVREVIEVVESNIYRIVNENENKYYCIRWIK